MNLSEPNPIVLEAQSRVCTGPHQSRPLGKKPGDPHPKPVLEAMLQTLKGIPPKEGAVSDVQMGAFFAAMTLRQAYPKATGWSDAETETFRQYHAPLQTHLPPDLQFLRDPEKPCPPENDAEKIVIEALKGILKGQHLTYDLTRRMCEGMLSGNVRGSLMGAAVIGQRMNRETDHEVRAYLDSVFPPESVQSINVPTLTHFGNPYNGSTRYFKPTIFVAAVRAAQGRPAILHGVDHMPPKWGITDEQMLLALGAQTNLSIEQAARCLENSQIGFAYLSQREYAPNAYALRDLRTHIAKRPPWAATEKAQQILTCPGENHIVIGYYHTGYEHTLLKLARERGFQSAIVIKGEEGACHFSLRLGKASDETRNAINFAQGFRQKDGQYQNIACDIDPADYGFQYSQNPRPKSVDAAAWAKLGLEALSGASGPTHDRIVLNAALTDHLLGFEPDASQAVENARNAIKNGQALKHLQTYIQHTKSSSLPR